MSCLLGIASVYAQTTFPIHTEIPNIVEPVRLNLDTTILYLADYVIEPMHIDSLVLPAGLSGEWNKTRQTFTVVAKPELAPLCVLRVWCRGTLYSIVLKRSTKRIFTISYNPTQYGTAHTVQLAGEMNDWSPTKNHFTSVYGVWKTEIALNPGTYQYQLVIDDKWRLDPANHDSVSNGNGGFNSLFKTPQSDYQPKVDVKMGKGNSLFISLKKPTSVICLWENYRLDNGYLFYAGDNLTLNIPPAALKIKRTHIRIYVFDKNNAYQDYLIPLEYGKPITTTTSLDRSDKQTNRMYFVLVDRFSDGDPTNNKKTIHPDIKDKANYYGGDLSGISQKIKEGYFDSLHINSLWISPIIQNPEGAFQEYPEPHDWYSGYHGYWPLSLTQIDHRFGTEEIFTALTSSAHQHHINILLDLVANHVHEDYPLIKQHPEWPTVLDLPDGRKNIRIWDEFRLTTWFDTFLPTLDFTQPAVVKLEVDSAIYWIRRFNIDGFRHDATKHIPEIFWRTLTLKLKKETPSYNALYQIGETYGSKELIGLYINSGMLDGQFDFNLYFDAREAFAKDSVPFTKVAATLHQSIDYYGSHHLMGNITGNHDIPRFASLAGGGLSFTEDPRKAGWSRTVGIGNDIAYPRMAMLMAFLTAIPGVPVIYYGDEIAMPGAGDPDNRRMMRFNDLSDKENSSRPLLHLWLSERPICHSCTDRLPLIQKNKR
jgi:glycosidase